jgi:hypothetical protein
VPTNGKVEQGRRAGRVLNGYWNFNDRSLGQLPCLHDAALQNSYDLVQIFQQCNILNHITIHKILLSNARD